MLLFSTIASWMRPIVERVLRKLVAKPPAIPARSPSRTLAVIAVVLEYDGQMPVEIMSEAALTVKGHLLERCNSIQVTDPRMSGRSIDLDCRYSIEVYHYAPDLPPGIAPGKGPVSA